MNYNKLYKNYKKLKNLSIPVQEGIDARQYGKKRAEFLLSKGYSPEQAQNIIQKYTAVV